MPGYSKRFIFILLFYHPRTLYPMDYRRFPVFRRFSVCQPVERGCLSTMPAGTIAWDEGGDLIVVIR